MILCPPPPRTSAAGGAGLGRPGGTGGRGGASAGPPLQRRCRKPEAAGALGRQGETRLGAWGRGRWAGQGEGRPRRAEPRWAVAARRQPLPLVCRRWGWRGEASFNAPPPGRGGFGFPRWRRGLPGSCGGSRAAAEPREAAAGRAVRAERPPPARGQAVSGLRCPACGLGGRRGLVPCPARRDFYPVNVGRARWMRPVTFTFGIGKGGGES